MQLSNFNAETLLLDLHQDIEEYADLLVTKILEEQDFDFLNYPPNGGLTNEEKAALDKLDYDENLKNALRKVVADNAAGIIFNLLNLMDGTAFPKNEDGRWTGVKLVDEETGENAAALNDWLHDKFYEMYWEWKKRRGRKPWKLDLYEE